MKLPKTHKMYTHHLEETVGLSYLQFLKDPLKKSSSEVSYSTVKISSFKIS